MGHPKHGLSIHALMIKSANVKIAVPLAGFVFLHGLAYWLAVDVLGVVSLSFPLFAQVNVLLNASAVLAWCLLLCLLPSLLAKAALIVTHIVLIALYLSLSVYFSHFEAIPDIFLLRQLGEVPDVMDQVLSTLIGAREIALVVSLVIACCCSFLLLPHTGRIAKPWAAAVAVLVFVGIGIKDTAISRMPGTPPEVLYGVERERYLRKFGFIPTLYRQIDL